MRKRKSLDETYLQLAEKLAECRVYATRAQVGALLVKNKTILAEGYNGMPAGMPNEDVEGIGSDGLLHTSPLVIHAEANVFDKLSKNGSTNGARGATLYCSYSPCFPCALRIINNGIKRVVYRNFYRDQSGIPILRKAGVKVVQLEGEIHEQRTTSSKPRVKGGNARPSIRKSLKSGSPVKVSRASKVRANRLRRPE